MKEEEFNRTISQHRQLVSTLTPSDAPANIPFKDFDLITVYRPTGISKPYPTLLYIPGNAFVARETGYTHFICTHIAEQARCQVILIKHRLAPEFQFPIGLQDAYKIIRLLLNSAKKELFNIDLSRVAIAGYSSGGNLAALITILAKRAHLPIARQLLISPITDLSRSLKGFEEFQSQDTAISEQFVKWFLRLYIPKEVKATHPMLSPYWVKSKHLQKLPTTDLIFGELDRFRADSELYGKRLIKQGNLANYFMFKKENHGLLWHNIGVIKTIVARLSLSFGTEPIPRELVIKENLNHISVVKLSDHYALSEKISQQRRKNSL